MKNAEPVAHVEEITDCHFSAAKCFFFLCSFRCPFCKLQIAFFNFRRTKLHSFIFFFNLRPRQEIYFFFKTGMIVNAFFVI